MAWAFPAPQRQADAGDMVRFTQMREGVVVIAGAIAMRWPARSKAARASTNMMSGISPAAAGDNSGMPSEPSTRRSLGDQARKVSDLPRALMTGSARARQPASLSISGAGSISLRIGE